MDARPVHLTWETSDLGSAVPEIMVHPICRHGNQGHLIDSVSRLLPIGMF